MIQTDRLYIRAIQADNAYRVFRYRSDAETNKYQGWIPKTIEEVDAFIAKNPVNFNIAESWFQLVIIQKNSDSIIGDIGVHFVGEENSQCELGITLDKNFQGKGYATEALKAVMDYLFNTLNKHRIFASIDPDNINSTKLMDRLNFRKEAHFKKSLFIDGIWVDDVIFAILQEEWK